MATDHPALELLADIAASSPCKVEGRVAWSSNNTLIVSFETANGERLAVYKPESGERPLDDFAAGLWKREIGAYRVSKCLGWPRIAETIEFDGPFGIGSLQAFVDHDPEQHYFTFGEDREMQSDLARIALFDVVINNTDRKGGHIIVGTNNELWCIDHGLSFNTATHLRTVLWKFAGERIEDALLEELERAAASIAQALTPWMEPSEIAATLSRIEDLRSARVFPHLTSNRQLPWPLV